MPIPKISNILPSWFKDIMTQSIAKTEGAKQNAYMKSELYRRKLHALLAFAKVHEMELQAHFAPKANNTYKGVYIDVYPHHNDTAGYKLEQSNSDTLESEERYNDNRQKVTVAKSIMIHVGGYYHNEKDSTYDDKPRTRAGGSLGCFGITNKNNSIKNPADKETKSIIDKIREKSDEDTIFGYSDVTIIIQKRNNVERIKKVNLPY